MQKKQKKRTAIAVAFIGLLLVWVQPIFGSSTRDDSTSKGLKTVTNDVNDPVCAATGEYYFHKKLFDLGGLMPLDNWLYYGSIYWPLMSGASNLPFRFAGSHKPMLYTSENSTEVLLGRGEEVLFERSGAGAEWQASDVKADAYQLKETTNYFYLLDPQNDRITTFKKGVISYGTQYSFAVRIEDRNGNALAFENPADVLNIGPTRISDGLGRTLDFTYTALTYTNAGSATVYTKHYLTAVQDQTGRHWELTYEADDKERVWDSDAPYVLRTMTDPMGQTTRFSYGGIKRITGIMKPEGNTPYTNAYNPAYEATAPLGIGVIQTQTDAYGHAMTLTANQFEPETNPETRFTATYPDGASTVYDHTHDGRLMKGLTDAAGKSASFQPDSPKDRVTSVIDRLGDTTRFTYHSETGRLASVTNAKGETVTYTYGPQDQVFTNPENSEQVTFTLYNLTRIDYPDGTHEAFTYDAKGNVLTGVDRAGKSWTYTYNTRGQVLTVRDPLGEVATHTYNDADGTLASITDPDGVVQTFTYDACKRLQRITHPDSTYIEIGYNLNDQVTSIRDENGHTYTYAYNKNGERTGVTDPKGRQVQYAYDLMDRVTQITDRLGKNTALAYDSRGRIASITDPNSIARLYQYNSRGWLDRLTIGGETWQAGYDDEGVPSSSTTPLGQATAYQTDKLGHVTGITDPLGQQTTLTRDSMSRITGVTDPLNRTTTYAYDNRDMLTGVTSPTVGAVDYQRNDLGLLTRMVDLNGRAWAFEYSKGSRLTSITDPLSHKTTFSHDGRGRLRTVTYPDGTSQTITYDSASNVTRRQYTGGSTLQYAYDELNRLITADNCALTRDAEGRILSTDNPGIVFGAGYDDGGRLHTATYNNGLFTVTYTYEATTGLLDRVTDSLTGVRVDLDYDENRRLRTMNLSNGEQITYTWDNAGRLTRIQSGNSVDLVYTLDAAGQVSSVNMTAPLDPATLLQGATEAFTYDQASQVAAAGYAYDLRGRLTAAPGHTFTWDGASRLTGIDGVSLGYNGLGDLITRDATHYYYNKAIGLSPMVAEKNETSGAFLRYYVWTPSGRLLYMIDAANGNKVYFYHFDRTGSTLTLTDQSGTVTDSYAYTPYGKLLGHNGTNTQPFTFVGQWGVRQEGDSGALYQMRARYYDARTARFISREPLWPGIGNPQELNSYQYALNTPVRFGDVTGTVPGDLSKAETDFLKELAKSVEEGEYAEQVHNTFSESAFWYFGCHYFESSDAERFIKANEEWKFRKRNPQWFKDEKKELLFWMKFAAIRPAKDTRNGPPVSMAQTYKVKPMHEPILATNRYLGDRKSPCAANKEEAGWRPFFGFGFDALIYRGHVEREAAPGPETIPSVHLDPRYKMEYRYLNSIEERIREKFLFE